MFSMLKKIYPAYVSKHNSNHEKQVICLLFQMEKDGDGIILQKKKLSALLREITSKNNGDFYCLNCRHSFRTKNKLGMHKKSM